MAFWTLASALDYASIPISLKMFFARLEYLGYNSAMAFFAAFFLVFSGQEAWLKKTWARTFLIFIPLSSVLLAWTNDWHGWLWSGFTQAEGNNTLVFHHGPGFLWAAVCGYILISIILVTLWRAAHFGTAIIKQQARLLFAICLLPLFTNLTYLLKIPGTEGVDWSPIPFSFGVLAFWATLYGRHFLKIAPIARETLIERMIDGMIVLDKENPGSNIICGLRKNEA